LLYENILNTNSASLRLVCFTAYFAGNQTTNNITNGHNFIIFWFEDTLDLLLKVFTKYKLVNYFIMPDKSPGPQIKDKDQYEALRDKGYSKQKSARISNSQGAEKRGGKSNSYTERTKEDLYKEATKVGIKGRSKMTKEELMKALRSN
jgi:hypothetical protein